MSADIGINTYMIYFAIIVISFAWFWKRLRNQRYHFDKRIIIFSRYPEAGFTKTRLVPEMGTDGAAVVQKLMVSYRQMLALLQLLQTCFCSILWCTPLGVL